MGTRASRARPPGATFRGVPTPESLSRVTEGDSRLALGQRGALRPLACPEDDPVAPTGGRTCTTVGSPTRRVPHLPRPNLRSVSARTHRRPCCRLASSAPLLRPAANRPLLVARQRHSRAHPFALLARARAPRLVGGGDDDMADAAGEPHRSGGRSKRQRISGRAGEELMLATGASVRAGTCVTFMRKKVKGQSVSRVETDAELRVDDDGGYAASRGAVAFSSTPRPPCIYFMARSPASIYRAPLATSCTVDPPLAYARRRARRWGDGAATYVPRQVHYAQQRGARCSLRIAHQAIWCDGPPRARTACAPGRSLRSRATVAPGDGGAEGSKGSVDPTC